MKKSNQIEQLDQRILALRRQQKEEFQDLKSGVHQVYYSLTPSNLVKQAFRSVVNKETLITIATGLVGGYLTKKFAGGNSDSPFRNILGTAVQFVTNYFSKQ